MTEVTSCARCGEHAPPDGPSPLTWSRAVDGESERWYCPRCSREHLRSIEGRIDEEWWA